MIDRIDRRQEIETEAAIFLGKNPAVWGLFVRFTLEAIAAGHKHLSADMILHRCRWEASVATTGAGLSANGEPLKLNNNFTAHFARLFHQSYPEHDGFFRTREIKAAGIQP